MADEIVQNLIEKITQNFNEKCRNHYLIQKFEKKVLSGKADLTDVERYAGSIGSQLSKSLLESIDFTEFENGRMYLELSEEILTQTLKNNYNLINQAAEKVQKDLDSRLGFMIKSQKADFPIDRIKAIASSLCDKTVSDDTIRRRMSSPVENVTHSFYTDSVKKNAQFRNDAGLKCYLVRKTNGKCCDWCSSIAGRYVYGDHPDDIFRRHDNCGCTVTFENGRVRQNVWTKRTWEVPDIDIGPYEPAVISPEKSKMLQEKNLPKTLTSTADSGKIKEKERDLSSPSFSDVSIPQNTLRGSENFSEKAKKKLYENERIISGNRYETAIVYNSDGSIAFKKKGNSDSVSFTSKEIKELNGKILTHNHPNGSNFSTADINMLRRGNLSEIRACNSRGTYILNPPKEWHKDISDFDSLDVTYEKIYKETSSKYRDQAAQTGKSIIQFLDEIEDEAMKTFCDKYGLNYKWEDK